MSRHRFEAMSSFFPVVTLKEEDMNNHPLKKVLPLYALIKERSLEFFQPLRELSIDERMVRSKARTHFRQYIRNKPTKWGFKFWVLSDVTGYTVDFNLYCGRRDVIQRSENGLAYDVVLELMKPFYHQGYQLFVDNFYTSPKLFRYLKTVDVYATGTLRINRQGVPPAVTQLRQALDRRTVPRGEGYYIKDNNSTITYICWKDNNVITLATTAYPGTTGGLEVIEVPVPVAGSVTISLWVALTNVTS